MFILTPTENGMGGGLLSCAPVLHCFPQLLKLFLWPPPCSPYRLWEPFPITGKSYFSHFLSSSSYPKQDRKALLSQGCLQVIIRLETSSSRGWPLLIILNKWILVSHIDKIRNTFLGKSPYICPCSLTYSPLQLYSFRFGFAYDQGAAIPGC